MSIPDNSQKLIITLFEKLRIKQKPSLLMYRAFIHKSYLNENRGVDKQHNERLEFLGDAVLELVITQTLYLEYSKQPEGVLTNWRSALVKTESLARVSKDIGLDQIILLSKGEQKAGGQDKTNLLADVIEAFIGALYLSYGLDVASKFILENIYIKLPEILKNKQHIDPKSKLQEILQDKYSKTPIYRVIATSGPDHNKNYKIGVYVEKKLLATGEGSSKQIAQQGAAQKALEEYAKSK